MKSTTNIQFEPPLANADDFPVPRVSATPERHKIAIGKQKFYQQSQYRKSGLYTKNGRSALAYIIKELDLDENSTVLLPVYHCPAMVEPFLWAKVNIQFYPLNDDLSVNLTELASMLSAKVDAILLVKFFGFDTNTKNALVQAKAHELKVIEDCAHAFFSPKLTSGSVSSDASFCSLNKFFSCFDGGMLNTSSIKTQQTIRQLGSTGLVSEVKEILGRFDSVSWLSTVFKRTFGKDRHNVPVAPDKGDVAAPTYRYFNEQDMLVKCFYATRLQLKFESYSRIAYKRRKNYHYLYGQLLNSTVGTPLYELNERTVPYVFPFLLHDRRDFNKVREAGIQILRWEEYCVTENAITESYRERLIQVPCHQDLTKEQLSFIVQIINKK
ncbi:DegT/DnrJ/EryC1/StrS family aminotransferase [Thalassotalea atypica]|uniref:DegT/DnrJ/EryC1/StrS family aminotransferase n=1 Tax=Thalassotalea atypica TaxID=2054316 RepID=UPI002572B134|nr:DegT/DnrJ/EryC1/StrS family aminotransferase [Thalassotalea atypica]